MTQLVCQMNAGDEVNLADIREALGHPPGTDFKFTGTFAGDELENWFSAIAYKSRELYHPSQFASIPWS